MSFFGAIRQIQRFDWIMLLSTALLFLFGLAAIYSVELSRESADFILVKKQLLTFVLGLILLTATAFGNYVFFRSWGRVLYFVGLALMVLVLIFGRELNGTRGWFIFFGVSFQPVEYMKVALAIQLARYFGEHARRRFGWQEIFGSGLLTTIPIFLTALQPDVGSAMLMIGLWAITLFFAGIRAKHVVALSGIGIIFSILSWFWFLEDYQKDRLLTFLYPSANPLSTGYNVMQAKIAIGSGQWFGRGLGFGSQSQLQFLPESQTDFIFAVIGEELGFLGVMILLIAFTILLFRILRLAKGARDNFTGYLALTFFALFCTQMIVNIGVNLSLLPATGIALPFVSYGGSSLLFSMVVIGICQSIAMHRQLGAESDILKLA